MKTMHTRTLLLLVLLLALLANGPAAAVQAQESTATATATVTATATRTLPTIVPTMPGYPAAQTEAPAATQAPPTGLVRPILVIDSYDTGDTTPTPGAGFDLHMYIKNVGRTDAYNLMITFSGADFLPQNTGGVQAIDKASSGYSVRITQPMITSTDLWGGYGSVGVNISYSDPSGVSYTDTFNLSIGTRVPSYNTQPTATPTPTGRAQIVVGGYTSSVEILQPGSIFDLNLELKNLGIANAHGITMVLGGGTAVGDNGQGTQVPGGISGSGSDVSIFAPLGQSNVVFLGDVPAGGSTKIDSHLIVNVTAQPGAYPFKISFIYTDDRNQRVVDDQVITLLIYSLPNVEVSFYRDPGVAFVGQPLQLPLQVTNLGRKMSVLGSMRVSSPAGEVQNNVTLVGSLEPGGYFPLDAMLIPNQPGEAEISVAINYTDDFNQPREITQTLTVNVQEGGDMGMPTDPSLNPGGEGMSPDGLPVNGGGPGVQGTETLWQKIVRVVKGLFGLGSSAPSASPEGIPSEGKPIQPEEQPSVKPIPKG